MDILDMTIFMDHGIVSETVFFDKVESFDWERLRDKRVLVKGCGTTIIPPWAFMVVTARLSQFAKTIAYGNEHSAISIFRRIPKEAVDVKE